LKYLTQAGRTVYGGGGIMPDEFVPLDTLKFPLFLKTRLLIYQFA
jgi:carboxyl-terminal processing protease